MSLIFTLTLIENKEENFKYKFGNNAIIIVCLLWKIHSNYTNIDPLNIWKIYGNIFA